MLVFIVVAVVVVSLGMLAWVSSRTSEIRGETNSTVETPHRYFAMLRTSSTNANDHLLCSSAMNVEWKERAQPEVCTPVHGVVSQLVSDLVRQHPIREPGKLWITYSTHFLQRNKQHSTGEEEGEVFIFILSVRSGS